MTSKLVFKLITKLSDFSSRQLGFNSADVTDAFLHQQLKSKIAPVVFDVGANVGEFSLQCLNANSTARVFAFEPQAEVSDKIRENLGVHANLIPVAMSDSPGTMHMTRKSIGDRKAHSIQSYQSGNLVVKKSTIDIFISENSIEAVDILKIDTEGHDYKVMVGARDAITSGKIKTIVFEVMPRLFANESSPKMMEVFLRDAGYTNFYRITPHLGLMPLEKLSDGELRTQNIVCLR